MPQLFANNAFGSLGATLSAVSTSLTLATGQGARFPAPTGGDHFMLTLVGLDGNGNENAWEVVRVTARSSDTLTVTRAQESTTAALWASGTRVEMRATAGTLAVFLQPDNIATLTNKTLGSNTVIGATVTGTDNLMTRVMLQDTGWDFHDSGTTNALDYVNGSVQRWAPNTGAQTLSITNWPPSGAMGELLIQGVNLGAATITWPTVNWIKSDGTTTTTFSSNGVTLQSSGTDWVMLWTRDGGTTIFGKVIR